MVAPRFFTFDAIVMPDVRAPESAGTVIAKIAINGSSTHADLSAMMPTVTATMAETIMIDVMAR